ncbi:MAG TPA: diversity-generating retroelement protein Avd [Phycisphaerae bacterium]|nr:diversity-generating retroelement protein Avd [Phycisphaerae bacterium]HRY70700.1 diversity-generating retroelement protein Avd [Phycisphaerae bacterium]HSA28705.1 diversity-generating retroelement protein Avd [Phycisphaerae bacterium]
MAEELKVIADFYDFMLWMIQHTEEFPRHHRYSLGLAMENRLQTILTLLLTAKYSREKVEALNKANLEMEVLRFQVRLAKDLGVLPVKSHGFAAQTMQSIGSQVGGWVKDRRPTA